jgi:arginyl-tRNA synthetase
MNIQNQLIARINGVIHQLYQPSGQENTSPITLQKTKKEFEGDFTLVCFGLTKLSKKNPSQTATEIGETLVKTDSGIAGFNVVNGFLNINLTFASWVNYLQEEYNHVTSPDSKVEKVMIEYSSPNTNKPLHLGHIRNNLLGYSVSNIIQAAGNEVIKVNLINDRGIHICKSMLAWQRYGNGETPQSSGLKGDHLVGKYYVEFDKALKIEAVKIQDAAYSGDFSSFDSASAEKCRELIQKIENQHDPEKQNEFLGHLKLLINSQTPLMKAAQEMLRDWENGDPEVINLWKTMNSWVYDGFKITYDRLGVSFDKFYHESETYLLGKELVSKGLQDNVLLKKEDGSVWIDLTAEGLDQKILLRSDGTSVYMTQDLGTAVMRHDEFNCTRYVYVVGNEQDYHFKVLSLSLQKLGYEWASGIYHLSYGMVDLPSGKMKSREGTVVDADDLIAEVIAEARKKSEELGKTADLTEAEKERLYTMLGMAALKYYILKVDPKKRMVFNPEESIDLNGNTGPFIQYTFARIRSIGRKADGMLTTDYQSDLLPDEPAHRSLIRMIYQYDETVQQAAESFSPALIANYAYDLAKEFNQFYHDFSILKEPDINLAAFRLDIAVKTSERLKQAMGLLGIEMPEKM